MSNFPSSLPAVGAAVTTNTLAQQGHTALHNNHSDEIVALATKIGTGTSTPAAGSVLRATGLGTSTWGSVVLTTDISGTLGIGNGGTGTTSSTGTGSVVLNSSPTITSATLTTPSITTPVITMGGSWAGSPTIVTPNIASFTNAQHDHTNSAGGGLITAAAISPNAITLGYNQITTTFSNNTSGAYVDVTGLAVTVTVPNGGRYIKITANVPYLTVAAGAPPAFRWAIAEGSTVLAGDGDKQALANNNNAWPQTIAVFIPTPGAHTYKVQFRCNQNSTLSAVCSTTDPAFILVEAI